jgi:carboxyl-terminal processing protease
LVDGLADHAGVQSGAELIAIDGKPIDTSDIPKFALSNNVQVTFKNPAQEHQTFSFNPTIKPEPNCIRHVTHRRVANKIGYVRISKWPGILGMDVARATDDAIKSLSQPEVLIIDIRGNLGSEGAGNLRLMGYLTPHKVPVGYSLTRARAQQGYRREELAQFTKIPGNQLLAPLTLLKFKDVDKSIVVVTEGLGRQPFHGRILMLVNEHTISGAEIVAGFASDHGLATLIGSRTAGKLLGWSTIALQHDYHLTLPTVNYLTWEGHSFEAIGVEPHIPVSFSPDAAINGEDNQLNAAIARARDLI